jgi:hypothetical protein
LLPLVADETHHYGYQEENRHMTAAFAQGRAPAETLDDGLLVTELLMTCYLSAELGETLRFPVSGIADYVPEVQRGQWSPQALVDQAKLRSIEKPARPARVSAHGSDRSGSGRLGGTRGLRAQDLCLAR